MSSIPEIELQSRENIKRFQEEKLKQTLAYVSAHSPFYKNLFKKSGTSTSDISRLEDLPSLPVTTKDDLQQYNWDFLCVSRDDIVEYTSTSGTLGKPVTIALTEKDLQRLAYNESISFACADGKKDDLYQLMLTLDRQFMAGIAYYEGIRKLGAGLIRVGPGLPALQWETIERLKPTVLVAVPSFIIKLIEFAKHQGIDLNNCSVKKAICIGESLRNADLELNTLGTQIFDAWKIRLYSTYASTEMQTAFTECSEGSGGHHHPELIIVELLDENNQPVKEGEIGEVTITTLGVEAMPLVRYKTGDMVKAYHTQCSCGRNTLRLGPVLGRHQQMIKLKGTTMYPPGIYDILNQFPQVTDYVVEAYTGTLGTDEIKLHICVVENAVQVEEALKNAFQSRLRVVPNFEFISSAQMDKLQHDGKSRKIKKFIDNRK
ncbi:AMP-binding protein [Chryseolinea sp. H1M3-3]|uniref:phenylacetate--CoA ligase family protein n=1 Tax=Chryseolinea sp. H1M3-3 TaxID=3034144 RepID=UPI0023EE1B42|nr:AMP-binding protein [Chryseolinea sp. H1M3-3]